MMTRMFPNNRFSRKRFVHLDRDTDEPLVAGYVSGASKMMPRKVVEAVGHLDERLFYHVDADYCIRIAEAGYKNYYLPTATIIHLNHDDGRASTTKEKFRQSWSGAHVHGGLRQRFGHMLKFHVQSFYYYTKHMQRGGSAVKRSAVMLGFASHFVAMATIQSVAELLGLVRSLRTRANHAHPQQ
jgi:GT2 family glycosyltransferase